MPFAGNFCQNFLLEFVPSRHVSDGQAPSYARVAVNVYVIAQNFARAPVHFVQSHSVEVESDEILRRWERHREVHFCTGVLKRSTLLKIRYVLLKMYLLHAAHIGAEYADFVDWIPSLKSGMVPTDSMK